MIMSCFWMHRCRSVFVPPFLRRCCRKVGVKSVGTRVGEVWKGLGRKGLGMKGVGVEEGLM